jgi:hypothetical protein
VALVARDPVKGRATLAELQAASRRSYDTGPAQRLWQVSEQLTGLRQPT